MEPIPDGTTLATAADVQTLCLEKTADALYQSGAATESEIQAAAHLCYRELDESGHSDLIECVARAQGHDENRLPEAIRTLAQRASRTMTNPPVLIPFAPKLIVPNAFYGTYPEIHTLCRDLLCPLLYAEDTDAIGVGSINPIAASLAAERIASIAHQHTGIRPFITISIVDYPSWGVLNRKHFKR